MAQASSLLLQRPGFDPRPVCVRFVVDKVALGQGFIQVLQFSSQYTYTTFPYSFVYLTLILHCLSNLWHH